MENSVSFISLAYLIEVSVVVNLAYRELKYPNLHHRLESNVKEILNEAKMADISEDDLYYKKLKNLMYSDINTKNIWVSGHQGILEFFYTRLIKQDRGLIITNSCIFFNVLILLILINTNSLNLSIDIWERDILENVLPIIFGFFIAFILLGVVCLRISSIYIFLLQFLLLAIPIAAAYSVGYEFEALDIWLISFAILVVYTLVPLFFIKLSINCEKFLFGEDDKNGVVYQLKYEMFKSNSIINNKIDKEVAESNTSSKATDLNYL